MMFEETGPLGMGDSEVTEMELFWVVVSVWVVVDIFVASKAEGLIGLVAIYRTFCYGLNCSWYSRIEGRSNASPEPCFI